MTPGIYRKSQPSGTHSILCLVGEAGLKTPHSLFQPLLIPSVPECFGIKEVEKEDTGGLSQRGVEQVLLEGRRMKTRHAGVRGKKGVRREGGLSQLPMYTLHS